MQRQPVKPLTKQKRFLVPLIIGILCMATSITLFFVIVTHLDSCLAWNACSEQSSGYYNFCVKDGAKYCCGGWGNDHQSCGQYIGICRWKGGNYIQCGPVFKAELAFLVISAVFLIIIIAVVCNHRSNKARADQLLSTNSMENYVQISRNNAPTI